jgi:hypothetical protein
MSDEMDERGQYQTYRECDIENERRDSHASSSRSEMNVSEGMIEGNLPVRAFVSTVRRTKRNITKLEYRLPSLRARDSYRNISSASRNFGKRGREEWRSRTSSVIAMVMSVSANALGIDQN